MPNDQVRFPRSAARAENGRGQCCPNPPYTADDAEGNRTSTADHLSNGAAPVDDSLVAERYGAAFASDARLMPPQVPDHKARAS